MKSLSYFLFWSVLKCALVIPVIAQSYSYIRYTTDDGLPTNYVYGVVEDEDGYIWAYTENGLAKFDGYQFQCLTTEDGLPGNDVVYAEKAPDGKIWLYSYHGGIAYLYRDSVRTLSNNPNRFWGIMHNGQPLYSEIMSGREKAYTYKGDELIKLPIREVHASELDYFGTAWVLRDKFPRTKTSTDQLLLDSGVFYSLSVDSIYLWQLELDGSFYERRYMSNYYFYQDIAHIYWQETGGEIEKLAIDNCTVSKFYPIPGKNNFFVLQLQQAGKQLATYAFLNLSSSELNCFQVNDFGIHHQLHSSISIQEDAFWLSTDGGSVRLSYEGKVLGQVQWSEKERDWILMRSYTDSRGNIWQGTRNGGLLMIPQAAQKCRPVHCVDKEKLHFERILAVNEGRIIGITAQGAIYELNKEEGVLKTVYEEPVGQRFRAAAFNGGITLFSFYKHSFIGKLQGDEWYFTELSMATRPELLKDSNYKQPWAAILDYANFTCLTYHVEDQSWHVVNAGKRYMVYGIDWLRNKWDVKLSGGYAKLVYYDPWQDQVWGLFSDELVGVNGQEYQPLLSDSLPLENISALFSTAGKLWIGTEKNGLYYYDFGEEQLVFVVAVDQVKAIRADEDKGVLAVTNDGVLVVSAETPEDYHLYSVKDGLPTNEIEDVLAIGDSIIYVASGQGVHEIDRKWTSGPPLLDEALCIIGIRADSTTVDSESRMNLPYRTRQVFFDFSLRAYASGQDIMYRTKLEPFETTWAESRERQRRYLGLSPGKYQFHLQAVDRYGQVVKHDPVELYIRPAFWQTWWFKSLVVIGLLLLIIGAFTLRLRYKEGRMQEEKVLTRRLAKLELDALKSQMNPHFIFNALGSIQYYIQTHETELADDYLTRFASLMRKYLDSSRETFISLDQEIALLENYTTLEVMRFEQLFQVLIDVAPPLNTSDHYIPSMIIQPFVENAINHGLGERRDGRGLLSISFTSNHPSTIQCVVEDNGIGMVQAERKKRSGHRSSGMKIVAEKIETLEAARLVNVHINTTDANPHDETYPGTRVIIDIKTLSDEDA